jgi:drug/metabolite transporter (DMT)-like permease
MRLVYANLFFDDNHNNASLLGYLTFAIVAFLSIYAIKELELKVFFAITSLTYVVVLLFSYIFLNEKLTSNKIIGVILVTFGVILFNL